MKKAVIIVGPSGSGKSTLGAYLREAFPQLEFAVSATTRPPRGGEQDGIEYYFLNPEDFQQKIDADEFLEWKEFYGGKRYGTLLPEFERIWSTGKVPTTDVEVWGAEAIKERLGNKALVIFVAPPSFEVLEQRLRSRNTDSEEDLEKRLERVRLELAYQDKFDAKVVNNDLEQAKYAIKGIVAQFLEN